MTHTIGAMVLLAFATCVSAATPPATRPALRTLTCVMIQVSNQPSLVRLQDPKGRLAVVRDLRLVQNDIPGADIGPAWAPQGPPSSMVVTLIRSQGGLWRLTVTASDRPSYVRVTRTLERGGCGTGPLRNLLPPDSTATWELSWSGVDVRDTCWVKAVPVPTDSSVH